MFGFLKDKLKSALSGFAQKVEELPEEKPKQEPVQLAKPVEKITAVPESKQEKKVEPMHFEKPLPRIDIGRKPEEIHAQKTAAEGSSSKQVLEVKLEQEASKEKSFFDKVKDKFRKDEGETKHEEKKGIFEKIIEVASTTKISDKDFDEMFYDLEMALLESNVAYSVVEKIKSDLKKDLVDKLIRRSEVDDIVLKSLRKSIYSLFDVKGFDLIEKIKEKSEKPFIIVFVGVNGVGKTSSIAKIANYLKKHGITCVLAASDTWRAASIEQLEHHANKIGIKIIKHNYNSDPAAVAYDAVSFAKSKGIDAVLVDTAGRQHSNINLITEMQKIIRVIKPDMKIFVGESVTGSDCIEQAASFDEAIGIDGIMLSKADVDERGGAAISIEYIVKKPIIYMGTGQEYDDLVEFNKEKIVASIGL